MSRIESTDRPGDGQDKDAKSSEKGPDCADSSHPGNGARRALPAPPIERVENRGDPQPAKESPPADRENKDDRENQGEQKKQDAGPTKPPLYRRPVFWIVAGGIALIVVIGGVIWWLDARQKEKTDDAFITAHYVTVSPRVAGHVVQVLVDDNQDVKKGDTLVILDEKDFVQALRGAQAAYDSAMAQVTQARAQVASAKAAVAQAQADVTAAGASAKQAEADRERYQNVQKTDPRAVSQQQVDQANANARTTAAQLEAAKQKQGAADAQVKVAESQITAAQSMVEKAAADVDNAKLQLSYTRIFAVEDGQVTNRSVEAGNYITPGQALMAVVPRNVWVIANYKETQLRKMRVGQPVKVHVDAYKIDLDAHVQSVQAGSGEAFSLLPPENATGNYVKIVQRVPVKITFDQLPQIRLGPGMSVETTVNTNP